MKAINSVFLMISAALCILSFLGKKRRPKPFKGNAFWVYFAFAVVLALAVRLVQFGSVPAGVNQDGAMAAVDAKALAEYGTDRLGMTRPVHFTAWGFGQMSVLMSYMMVPFIKAFGLSVVTMRLPALLCSLMGLVFLFLFCRDVFNRELALVVLLLAAVNPWHMVQSRWALDCNIFPHMLIAGLYFLNHGVQFPKRRFFLYISMVFFALSMYCYGVALYTVPVFLAIACVFLLVSKKIRGKDALICMGIYMLLSWPFFAAMFINAFGFDTIELKLFTIPAFPETVRKADILFFSESFFAQLWANLLALLRVIFQIGDDYLCNVVPGFSTMYVFSLPFTITGFIWILKNWRRNPGSMLLLVFFTVAFFSGLITNSVNVNRINIIFYPLIVFSGIGVFRVIRDVKLGDAAVHAMYAAGFTLFCCAYFTSYAKSVSEVFLSDFGEALKSFDPEEYSCIYVTPDSQAEGRYYVSEILTLFYHDIDAQYYQSEEFEEKYVFKNPGASPDDSGENRAYVAKAEDEELFDEEKFEIDHFGRFITALPK